MCVKEWNGGGARWTRRENLSTEARVRDEERRVMVMFIESPSRMKIKCFVHLRCCVVYT